MTIAIFLTETGMSVLSKTFIMDGTIKWRYSSKFGPKIKKFLPDWSVNGFYNFQPAAATQLIAAQLDIPMQSGSHIWINNALKDLLGKLDNLTPAELAAANPTQRLAALVNFLSEASSHDAILSGGTKTGGFVGYLSKSDPDLIARLGHAPTTAELKALAFQGLSWGNIMGSTAGKEALALNPRIDAAGKLLFDGKLSNGGFFSKTAAEINAGEWNITVTVLDCTR